MLEKKETYDSIINEFQLSGSTLEGMKESIDALTKSRDDICKLLKIQNFKVETIESNEKEFTININANKLKVEHYKKKQVELKNNIKVSKQEIKVIKHNLNKLDDKLIQELQQSKKINEALRIFNRREKFKFIRKIIFRSYRKVFFKYSNQMYLKNQIMECNKRKEKIRQEKHYYTNSQQRHNRKIIMDRIATAEMRKNIINMLKQINFFLIKIQKLKDYKEIENKFILKARQYEKYNG